MSNGYPFDLLDGEEVLLETRPHFLSMLWLMVFWLAVGALGAVYIMYYPELNGLIANHIKFWLPAKDFLARHAYNSIWVASLLLPLVIMAVFRINFGYVLTLLALIAGNVILQWKVEPALGFKQHAHLENVMLMAVGVIGVIGVELFRRGHRYYLTNRRLVARFGALGVEERSVLYGKIDDLILQQTLLGKLMGFGTVIPVTSSGLGMGQDLAIAGAAAGGGKAGVGAGLFAAGGKVKNVPRDLSFYVLYRVPDPTDARDIIMEEMQERETRK